MSKYMCLCGVDFRTKQMSELHLKMWEGHIIVKKKLSVRFLDWFFKYNWGRFFRFSGLFMVYFVFIHHFGIVWNWWEASLIGLGLGMYVE